jgi:Mor family transcriptional regulator
MLLDEQIIWRTPEGKVIACVEKNKVLQENLAEIRQVCRDALEDAILMGCDEQQFRRVLAELVAQLGNPYPPRE